MEKTASMPKEILVGNKEVRQLVEPVARELGIPVHVGPLRLVEQARKSLFEHVGKRS